MLKIVKTTQLVGDFLLQCDPIKFKGVDTGVVVHKTIRLECFTFVFTFYYFFLFRSPQLRWDKPRNYHQSVTSGLFRLINPHWLFNNHQNGNEQRWTKGNHYQMCSEIIENYVKVARLRSHANYSNMTGRSMYRQKFRRVSSPLLMSFEVNNGEGAQAISTWNHTDRLLFVFIGWLYCLLVIAW